MKNFLYLFLVFTVFLAGCNKTEQTVEEVAEVVSETDNHEVDGDIEAIETDNGAKWKVNEEMKPFLADAQNTLASFSGTELSEYTALGEILKEQNNALIQSCTMDGKSHDELHKWLHPHLELTANLIQSESAGEAADWVNKLKASFDVYHSYFE